MSVTVIIGIIIALMFIVSFSAWFYHLIAGISVLVIHDIYFYYRLASWGFLFIAFMAGFFWLLALTQECPFVDRPKVGVFQYLNCNVYFKGKSLLAQIGIDLPTPPAPEQEL